MTPDLLFFWWIDYQAIKCINIEFPKFKKLTKKLILLLNQEQILVCDLITTELEWKKTVNYLPLVEKKIFWQNLLNKTIWFK